MKRRIILVLSCIVGVMVIVAAWMFGQFSTSNLRNAKTIGELPPPIGYERVDAPQGSYAAWLRSLPLKKRGTKVYLFKDHRKANFQWLSAAVVDMPLLSNDEQCADVCMRMRAEYLYSAGQYAKISFTTLNGEKLTYSGGNNRKAFEQYMRQVFGSCNTTSLHRSLSARELKDMQIGDVFVYPHRNVAGKDRYGHAVMVADMAVDNQGKKIFLLIEGNTPSRDIHIVRNFNPLLNPWHSLYEDAASVQLNVFRFKNTDLKQF